MAEHVLETRLLLRYGTYSQWMQSKIILKQGEAAVAIFPYTQNLGLSDSQPENTPPAVGLKIGDGHSYFDELPWVQAVAADVYSWAKNENKPTYTANEISGLAEFIDQHGSGGGGGGSASSGYRIIYNSLTHKYTLQFFDETQNDWVDTTSEIDLSALYNRINTIERWANGARTNLGNIELPIAEYIYEEVITYMNSLDYSDVAVEHQFVTEVTQVDGKITVQRSVISANDISSGVLSVEHGGTGLTRVEEDEVLIGTVDGGITKKRFVTEIENERNVFATVGAIKDYVTAQTAGLTGAMHYVGDATVVITNGSRIDPQISGYNFQTARAGDVVLANNAQEYVWTGTDWRLLGDEGSYAVKGSIRDADIAENAEIQQSKISELPETLNNKVDKIEGKGLSSNDYTTEEKDKLETVEEYAQVNTIEHIIVNDVRVNPDAEKTINLNIPVLTEEQIAAIDAAQENVIEHIFVNGTEIQPATINQLPKSIGINYVVYTQEEKDKLHDIEAGAEVNRIETISFNGGEPISPDNNKNIDVTIDTSALNLRVLEGARYPSGNTYVEIEKDSTEKLLELSKVAATGNIDDLVQTSNYVTFYCGSSVKVI